MNRYEMAHTIQDILNNRLTCVQVFETDAAEYGFIAGGCFYADKSWTVEENFSSACSTFARWLADYADVDIVFFIEQERERK